MQIDKLPRLDRTVMLSEAKHLSAPRDRCFASLSMTHLAPLFLFRLLPSRDRCFASPSLRSGLRLTQHESVKPLRGRPINVDDEQEHQTCYLIRHHVWDFRSSCSLSSTWVPPPCLGGHPPRATNGHHGISTSGNNRRAITRRWICAVPSKMSKTFASRNHLLRNCLRSEFSPGAAIRTAVAVAFITNPPA
jgi:hypothetical protein